MTPTDALIEKMARAIFDASDPQGSKYAWDDGRDDKREFFRRVARAAYEAEHEEDGK